MRSGARRYRIGIQQCMRHAMRRRPSPRFFPVSNLHGSSSRTVRRPSLPGLVQFNVRIFARRSAFLSGIHARKSHSEGANRSIKKSGENSRSDTPVCRSSLRTPVRARPRFSCSPRSVRKAASRQGHRPMWLVLSREYSAACRLEPRIGLAATMILGTVCRSV
jgi:hypothetical protein